MLVPGVILDGKFRIERLLGAGGMGVVAIATHLALDQRVAIKVLHDRVAADPSVSERLVREARAAARLRSEHICRVSDVGQVDGTPYIVMELLDGEDLGGLIDRGPLPIATAVDYVLQACVGLAEAHALGIVHRDLKPANLFVTRRLDGSPLIKVLDFGIAKASSPGLVSLTQTETMMGTPGFMSPEQLRSARDVDARTDLWALGVILYQAVSGRLPFPATSVTEVAVKIAMDPPEPLDVDPAFRAVVMHCLEKPVAQRTRDVGELARELAPFGGPTAPVVVALVERLLAASFALGATGVARASDAGSGAGTATTLATSGPAPTTTLAGAAGEPGGRSRAGRRAPIAIGGVLAVVGIGAVVWAVTRDPEPSVRSAVAVAVAEPHDGVTDAAVARDASPAVAVAMPAPAPARPSPPTSRRRADPRPAPARSIDELIYDAHGAQADGDMKRALAIAQAIVVRDPTNLTARHIGVSAACMESDVQTARELARPLPAKNRGDLVKLCSGYHVSLDDPTTIPAGQGSAEPSVAAATQRVARAAAGMRCMEASSVATTMSRIYGGSNPDETSQMTKVAATCIDTRTTILRTPGDPAAEAWVRVAADELRESGHGTDADELINNFYGGRVIDACSAGDRALAKTFATKAAASASKQRAIAFCTSRGIAIE